MSWPCDAAAAYVADIHEAASRISDERYRRQLVIYFIYLKDVHGLLSKSCIRVAAVRQGESSGMLPITMSISEGCRLQIITA